MEETSVSLPENYNLTPASIVPRADAWAKIFYGMERIALLSPSELEQREKLYLMWKDARQLYETVATTWASATPQERKDLAVRVWGQSTGAYDYLDDFCNQLTFLQDDLLEAVGLTDEEADKAVNAYRKNEAIPQPL